ncbi:MAG: hypothetical protein WA628_00840 [Terriglobales bacterium]
MKKQHLSAVLTLICLVGLGVGARAEDKTEVVDVPFEFVAGGKTLSAGTYSVNRVSSAHEPSLIILIRSRQQAVYLHPVAFDGVSGEDTQLNFEHVGDKYLLNKIKTSAGIYTIGAAVTEMGQKRSHDAGMSSSGTD